MNGFPNHGSVACTAPPGHRAEVERKIRTNMAAYLDARQDEIEIIEVPLPPWELRLVGVWWPPA